MIVSIHLHYFLSTSFLVPPFPVSVSCLHSSSIPLLLSSWSSKKFRIFYKLLVAHILIPTYLQNVLQITVFTFELPSHCLHLDVLEPISSYVYMFTRLNLIHESTYFAASFLSCSCFINNFFLSKKVFRTL